jgi:hypothetical protein
MAVVPFELDGVFTDALSRDWHGRGLKHGQFARFKRGFSAYLAATLSAFIVTHGARAGIPQEGKSVLRKVAIFPFDVHPGAFGKVHFDRFGIGMGHSERASCVLIS